MQNDRPVGARGPKPPFNHLRSLLETLESREFVSIFTGIKISKMERWFDPNSKTLPRGDDLVKLALFFECSVDYLLDLTKYI